MRNGGVLVVLTVLTGLCSTAFAGSLIPPTGLAPGSHYRLAFVTSGTTNALSTDIGYYDSFVSAEANALGSVLLGLDVT